MEPATDIHSGLQILRAVVITTILTVASLVLFGVYFETVDDCQMRLIASGDFGSSGPSPDLWYSHRLLGLVLSSCYRIFPNVDSYLLFHIAVHIVANSTWCWIFQRLMPGPRGWWCFALWFIIAGWLWLIPLQFTTSAFIAFSAGLALIFFDAKLSDFPKFLGLFRPCFLTGTGLLYIAHLIRHQSFQLGCLVAAPVVLFFAYHWPRRITLIQLLRALPILSLIIASNYGEFLYYNCQPEWQACRQHWFPISLLVNADRLDFSPANPRFFAREEQLAYLRKLSEIGWSAHDIRILRGTFADDKAIFPSERLAEAVRVLHPPTSTDRYRFWVFLSGAAFYWLQQPLVLIVASLSGIVALRLRLPRPLIWAVVTSLILFFLLSAYLKAFDKLPYRVLRLIALAPIFTVFAGITGMRRSSPSEQLPTHFIDWVIVLISAAAVYCLLQGPIMAGTKDHDDFLQIQNDIRNAPISAEYRYVIFDQAVLTIPPLEDASHLKGWRWAFPDLLPDHPLNREKMRSWGWHDASEGLRTDGNSRLLSNDLYAHELQLFFTEHYPDALLIKVWTGRKISIYRVVKQHKRKQNSEH